MSDTPCCDDDRTSPLERIAAGLTSLPRQLQGFGEVRRDLLAALTGKSALAHWRPEGDDLGLMWLEMWAYVADVVGFYDARIADQSYIGTAATRPALRRLVALLGYTPASGIAGRATVAAFAEGRVPIELPEGTAFRSRGFDGNPPQVFKTGAPIQIHALKNSWKVAPFLREPTLGTTAELNSPSPPNTTLTNELLFESTGFGLAADQLVLFDGRDPADPTPVDPPVSRVIATEPFEGKDAATYVKVRFEPALTIAPDLDLTTIRVRTPVQTAVGTANEPIIDNAGFKDPKPVVSDVSGGRTRVFLDGAPRSFRVNDPVIVAKNLSAIEPSYAATKVHSVRAAGVRIKSVPLPDNAGYPSAPATQLNLKPQFVDDLGSNASRLSFHFDMVDGGRVTNVAQMEVTVGELTDPLGVPIDGIVRPPPEAEATAESQGLLGVDNIVGVLEQPFLFEDAVRQNGRADARLVFTSDGRASFQALDAGQLPDKPLQLPLTLFGNLVAATRGEQVAAEILGSGDARNPNAQYTLRKKPLTYRHQPSASGDGTMRSTLEVFVDGVRWTEVESFFGCGPRDRVFVVRHDDDQNTTVTFGDGVRGERAGSGVQNIVANYCFGAGEAVPPAGAITQLADAVKGLQRVRSPIAASPGKDPESSDELRSTAPTRARLLGRIVSVADFEAVAANAPGVVVATAQWLWIDAQMQAGVHVHYIGDVDEAAVSETLRLQADPTTPVEVTRATPIPTTVSIEVEVDPRYVKQTVADAVVAHLLHEEEGVLSPARAVIGGTFWPSRLYAAVAEVDGVVAVGGVSFTTPITAPQLSVTTGTCIGSGEYLDFSGLDAVTVSAVEPLGAMVLEPEHAEVSL